MRGAATTYSLLSPKSREPRNTQNTRKHDITVEGFISVCSVCSVVKKNARIGGYHHRQRLCQPSGLDECKSVWIDQSVLHESPCVAAKQVTMSLVFGSVGSFERVG